MSELVAKRYARAVFDLARGDNTLREATRSVTAFADAYESSTDLRALERLPGVTDAQLSEIVGEIGKRLNAAPMVVRTVSLLAERRRLAVLPAMARLLDEMADDDLGVLRAETRAATQLSGEYLERLKSKIAAATGKKVIMSFTRDETLIAGVVTKIGDRVIDGSVRGKLDRLAQSLRRA